MAVNTTALRHKMVEKGIRTNKELANRTGVNENTIGPVLSSKARPSTNTIDKIAKTLELTPEEIGRIFYSQKQ